MQIRTECLIGRDCLLEWSVARVNPLPLGHPPVAEKMADLKRRYPAFQDARCPSGRV